MDRKDKEQFIIQAYKSGIPGKKICPQGNGNALYRFLKRPEVTTDRKVNEMYENAVREMKLAKVDTKLPQKRHKQSDTKLSQNSFVVDTNLQPQSFVSVDTKLLAKMEKRIADLERQVNELQREVKELRGQSEGKEGRSNKKLSQMQEQKNQNAGQLMGFNIRQSKTVTTTRKGKKYEYLKWYAIKNVKGRSIKIFLGDMFDEGRAKEKIIQYLEKHPEIQEIIE